MLVSHQRAIGGAERGSDVGQVETKCQVDVQCRLFEIWVCGGGKE